MKLLSGVLASSVLALAVLGGCAMNPSNQAAAAPSLKVVTSSHNIDAGTSARVTAETANVVGSGDIKWTVTPDVGHVKTDSTHGQTAVFSADQPGTYVVKAAIDVGNGNWVSDTADITVNGVTDSNGHPISSESH
jgi:hypothetical protein